MVDFLARREPVTCLSKLPLRREEKAMKSLSVKFKLCSLVGVFLVGFATFAALSYLTFSELRILGPKYSEIKLFQNFLADVLPPPLFIQEAYLECHELEDVTEPNSQEKLIQTIKGVQQAFERSKQEWTLSLGQNSLQELLQKRLIPASEQFFQIAETELFPAVREKRFDDCEPIMIRLRQCYLDCEAAATELGAAAKEHSAKVETASSLRVASRMNYMLVIAISMCVIVTLVSYLTSRAIINPLRETVKVLDRVSEGDLRTRVQVRSKDEIGQIGRSLNRAIENMSNMLRSIAQNAINLNDSSTQMSSVSQSLGLNATETSDKANAVSKVSTEINRDINTVATAVDQMSTSIVEISRNAGEATRVAAEAVQVAEQTNRIVRKLGDSSTDIGNVVKVITTIAQQTNLLALNATIEAARAGEAGKGFAVVANEVKELAKATAKATEEIGQKVEAIQSDTQGAVGAIAQISTIIDHMNDIFNTIASAVEEQTATANEISRSVGNAAQGSTGITTNIGGVADAARRTSDFADGTKTSANDLEQMARQLRLILDKFQFVQEAVARKSEDEFEDEEASLSA